MIFKRISAFVILCTLVLSCFSLSSCKNDDGGKGGEDDEVNYGKYIYVSESGDDANSGEESSPLRTLAGAVEAVRKIKAEGLPEGGVCVTFAKGSYPVTNTVLFTEAESGEEGKPIVFKGEDGAAIDGGVSIPTDKFVPASDEAKARLVSEDAKANVLEADLAALGVTEFGDERTVNGYGIELFCDTVRQTVARYPNAGEYVIAQVGTCTDDYIRQSIPDGRADIWVNSDTIRYYGYPQYDWRNHIAYSDKIVIDTETSEIQINGTPDCGNNRPYYVYNLIEELDAPGEYYVDPDEKKLYYYPDGSLEGKRLCVTNYADNFMEFGAASYITFDGLTFENARNCVAHYAANEDGSIPDSDGIVFKNCLVRDVSMDGIYLNGYNIRFENCEMYELGCGGVTVRCENRESLNPSNSSVENCYIHEFSRVYTVYTPAVTFSGYGFYCGHNEFSGSTHEAIAFNCSGSVFEYNYIHNVCSETSDAGAIYSGRRFDFRQNIIRYNLIENIVDVVHDGTPQGIYCDDDMVETVIYGNILRNIGGCGILIGGGKDMQIYNNIIIECGNIPILIDDRGLGWAFEHITYPEGDIWGHLFETGYLDALHRYSFPKNLIIAETRDSFYYNADMAGTPSYNSFCRNVAVNCTNDELFEPLDEAVRKFADKHDIELKFIDPLTVDGIVDKMIFASGASRRYGTMIDNIAYFENPGIADPENGDYTITDDSPIWRDIVGFEAIPFEEIGLYK